MMDSVKLLSLEWYARVEFEAVQLASETPSPKPFVLVEIYRGAPSDPDIYRGRRPGYRLEICQGEALLVRGVAEGPQHADVEVTMDFDAMPTLVLAPTGPELDAVAAAYAATGKISMVGSIEGAPIALARLHDAMQACTIT
jgi:hypothetical protein